MQNRTTSPKSGKSAQRAGNAGEADSQLQSIIETAVDAIITIDEEGIVDTFPENTHVVLKSGEVDGIIGTHSQPLVAPQ